MSSGKEITIEALEEKYRSNPDSLVFSRLADSYRKNGDLQKAIDVCNEGLQVHPDYSTGRIILGRCYLETENFGDAVSAFTEVCKRDQKNQMAIKMLADIYSKQGMEEKAGDLYSLLLSLDPENQSFVHLSGLFQGAGKIFLDEIIDIEDEESSLETESMAEEVSLDEIATTEPNAEESEINDGFGDILNAEETIDQNESEFDELGEKPENEILSENIESVTQEESELTEMSLEQEASSELSPEEDILEEISNESIDLTEDQPEPVAEISEPAVVEESEFQLDEDLSQSNDNIDAGAMESDAFELDEPVPTDLSDDNLGDLASDLEEIEEIPEELPQASDNLVSRVDSLFGDEESTVSVPVSETDELANLTEDEDLGADIVTSPPIEPTNELASRMGALFEEGESEALEVESAKTSDEAFVSSESPATENQNDEMVIEELTPVDEESSFEIPLSEETEIDQPVNSLEEEKSDDSNIVTGDTVEMMIPQDETSVEIEDELILSDTIESEAVAAQEQTVDENNILPLVEEGNDSSSDTIEVAEESEIEKLNLEDTIELSSVEEENLIAGEDLLTDIGEPTVNDFPVDSIVEMNEPVESSSDIEDVSPDESTDGNIELASDQDVVEEQNLELNESALDFISDADSENKPLEIVDDSIAEPADDVLPVELKQTTPGDVVESSSLEFSIDEVSEVAESSVDVSAEDVASRIDEIYPEDEATKNKKESVVTGDDVMERIEELFPEENDLDASSLEAIPDEEPDELPVSEFYSEDGDNASEDNIESQESLDSKDLETGQADSSLIMDIDSPTEDFSLQSGPLSDSGDLQNAIDELAKNEDSEILENDDSLIFDLDSPTMAVEIPAINESSEETFEDVSVFDLSNEDTVTDEPLLMEVETPTESVSLEDVLPESDNASGVDNFNELDIVSQDIAVDEQQADDKLIFEMDSPTVEMNDSDIIETAEKPIIDDSISSLEEPVTLDDSIETFELDEDLSSEEILLDDSLEDVEISSESEFVIKEENEPEVLDELDVETLDAINTKKSETELIIPSETMDEIDASDFTDSLENLEALPDEEGDEAPVSEFYTEEGSSAEVAEENILEEVSDEFVEDVHEEVKLDDEESNEEQALINEDTINKETSEFILDDDSEVILSESSSALEESIEPESSVFSISDDGADIFEDDVLEEVSDLEIENLGNIEDVSIDEIDDSESLQKSDEVLDEVENYDINDTLKELDTLEESENLDLESLPDEGEDESPVSEFYTETGSSAEEGIEEDVAPVAFSDTHAEENITEYTEDVSVEEAVANIDTTIESDVSEIKEDLKGKEDKSKTFEEQDFSKVENIPDHVLTPTLADIYFQQGQASLAVGIYKRLLAKNPENIKMEERIEEIEEYIRKSMEIEECESEDEVESDEKTTPKKSTKKKSTKKKGTSKAGKPLKGVRIKKKIKERIKKTKN